MHACRAVESGIFHFQSGIYQGDTMAIDKARSSIAGQEEGARRPYEAPSIRVMDEQEVLSAFQVTVAAITWWVM